MKKVYMLHNRKNVSLVEFCECSKMLLLHNKNVQEMNRNLVRKCALFIMVYAECMVIWSLIFLYTFERNTR